MKRIAVWGSIFALIAALGFVFSTQSVKASVNDFNFSVFKADYYLSKDDSGRATMWVVEQFTAEFPKFNQNKGVVRAIPMVFDGHPVSVDVKSLTRNGNSEPIYSKEKQNDNLLVSTGDDSYVTGPQSYELTYTLRDVIKDLGDSQEFHWDIVGLQHGQNFESVQANVHLDKSIVDLFTGKTTCQEGYENSLNKCGEFGINGQVITFNSKGQIAANQDMTIVMQFKSNSFKPFQAGVVGFVQNTLVIMSVMLSIAGLLSAVMLRFRRGRDASGRGTIIPEYLPPKQSIRIVGDLIKKPAKVVPAQIISLAVSHKIRIIESDKKSFLSTAKAYEIELINAKGLSIDEQEFLTIFFDDMKAGSKYSFDNKGVGVGNSLRHYQSKAHSLVIKDGYRRLVKSKSSVVILGIVALIFAFIISLFGFQYIVGPVLALYSIIVPIAFIGTLLSLTLVGPLRPLTEKGRELVDYVSGLEVYIKLAETDRIKVLQSPKGADKTPIDTANAKRMVKLYERVLPYAVLFGQEKEWAKQLTIYYEQSSSVPGWYMGASAFNAATFASSIGGMSSSVTSFSSPSSSGGSGFSGGGVGGGGGGGGFGGR